jgi:hypothetical protein
MHRVLPSRDGCRSWEGAGSGWELAIGEEKMYIISLYGNDDYSTRTGTGE